MFYLWIRKVYLIYKISIIFERSSDGSSGGFKNHIRQNHYMWNYLYCINNNIFRYCIFIMERYRRLQWY